MRIYYFASVPGIPMADQEAAAAKDGWMPDYAATYRESKNSFPKEARKAIAACRKSARDHIWVFELYVIAQRRVHLKSLRKALRTQGAYLLEGRTGWRTDKPEQYIEMREKIDERWSRKWLARAQAQKIGAKGGKGKGRSFRERRLPKGDAMLIWHNKSLTEEEALEKINGVDGYDIPWSRSAAFRHLGKRGMPFGPRAKR